MDAEGCLENRQGRFQQGDALLRSFRDSRIIHVCVLRHDDAGGFGQGSNGQGVHIAHDGYPGAACRCMAHGDGQQVAAEDFGNFRGKIIPLVQDFEVSGIDQFLYGHCVSPLQVHFRKKPFRIPA